MQQFSFAFLPLAVDLASLSRAQRHAGPSPSV